MILDTAMESAPAEWKKGTVGVVCSQCGEQLEKKGKKKRKLQTQGGQEVELVREYGVCPKWGWWIFPLDEELELLLGKLTPCEHERLVRLASWIRSFEKAVEVFRDFLGIEVGKITSQSYTEAAGPAYEQIQSEEVEFLERHMPPACEGAEKVQISADGTMVPLLHGVWTEVRTLAIGDVSPPWKSRVKQWCILEN